LLTIFASHWQNKHWLMMKEWKKIFQPNGPQKEAEVVTFISDK
jgi:hypothetical protein